MIYIFLAAIRLRIYKTPKKILLQMLNVWRTVAYERQRRIVINVHVCNWARVVTLNGNVFNWTMDYSNKRVDCEVSKIYDSVDEIYTTNVWRSHGTSAAN